MNKLFTYLLALCTATCLYGCSEELEEMTSTEESPSNIVSRSIPESFSCGTIETDPPAWYFNTPRVFNNNSIYTLNIYIHVIRSSSGVGFNNGYYRHKFSAEQIAKMRSIISQREEVSPTIHQKQIIGPKHFSNNGTYSLSVLNADESVRWEVTAYSENGSTKTTYTTSTLTLSSTQPTYYSIVASITSPAGTKSVTTHATCNEPSPYIGSLYWENNQGQYSITDATNYGGLSMYPETST